MSTLNYNTTTCKDVAGVEVPDLSIDAVQLGAALAASVQEVATDLNSKICEGQEASIQRDTAIAGLVSELDIRVKALQDVEQIQGLTDAQIQVLVEASAFFLNEDGSQNDLGTIVMLLNQIDASLDLKCEKTYVDGEITRLEQLIQNVDVNIDLSNYATLDHLCAVSTKVADKLNAFGAALVVLKDGVANALSNAATAVSNIALPSCVLTPFVLPTLTSAGSEGGSTPPTVG